MPHLLVRQQFDDYDRWKAAYDSQADRRAAASCTSAQVLRNDADPHEVLVLFEFTDMDKAREYIASPDLRAAWADAGVRGTSEKLSVTPVD